MIRTFSTAVMALLVLATTVSAQAEAEAPPPTETGSAPGAMLPGDVIKIAVWREPELSGQFTVQEDRTVALPRLGSYSVVGKTPADVEAELLAEYSRTLRDPVVEIVILKRIVITGEVRTPGLYPVDPTMTLTDALTLAGGPLPNAKENRVDLIRGGERTEYNLEKVTLTRDIALLSGDQLYVPKKHWIVRNWRWYTTIAGTLMSVGTFILVGKR